MTQAEIKNDLLEQLALQEKHGKFYIDLVNDYISYWKIKKQLLKDIKDKGLRYEVVTGNGFVSQKPNESVQNVIKVTNTMLKIMHDLNLETPLGSGDGDEEDYY